MTSPIFSVVWTYTYLATRVIASSPNYDTVVRSSRELACYREDPQVVWPRNPIARVTHHLLDTCNDDSSHEEINNCMTTDVRKKLTTYDIVPVMDTVTNASYKNVYCALCNNVNPNHVVFWNLRLKCSVTANIVADDLPDIVSSESCEATFQTPHYDLDLMDPSSTEEECYVAVDTCNVTGAWTSFDAAVKRDCEISFLNPLIWKGIVFENVDCAKCNGAWSHDVHAGYRGYPSYIDWSYSTWLNVTYKSFNVTFNDVSQYERCIPAPLNSENKMQNRCLQTRCSPLRHKHCSTCESRHLLLESYTYRICLRLRPRAKLTLKEAVHAWYHLHDELVTFLSSIIPFERYNNYKYEVILFSKHDTAINSRLDNETVVRSEFLHYDWRMKILVKGVDPGNNLNRLRLVLESSDLVIPIDDVTFAFDATLKDYVNEEYTLLTVEPHCMSETPWQWCGEIDWSCAQLTNSSTPRIALGFKVYYSTSVVFYSAPISGERNIIEMRDCLFVKVTINETTWTDTDFGLQFPNSDALLSYSDFLYGDFNEVIWMCEEKYLKMFEGFLMDINNAVKDVQSSAYMLTATSTYNKLFGLLLLYTEALRYI